MNRCWVLIYAVFGMYSKITIYLQAQILLMNFPDDKWTEFFD